MNNDLISREALKKAFEETVVIEPMPYGFVKQIIDNAPTVELTEEQAIDKLHETGWLIRHDNEMTERPHGEWLLREGVTTSGWLECSKCGASDFRKSYSNYCPNCGSDRRKRGVE